MFYTKKEFRELVDKLVMPEMYEENGWGKWEEVDKKTQNKIIQYAFEHFYEESNRDLEEMQAMLKENKMRRENYSFLIMGSALGVSGGLLSNIIHDLLKNVGTLYEVSVPVILVIVLWASFNYVLSKNSNSISKNKVLKDILNQKEKKAAS